MPQPGKLDEVFAGLRPLLAAHERRLVVLADEPGDYALGLPRLRDDGYRIWFGAVKSGARYVSFHLFPVYVHPDLLDGISDGLGARRHGKSCFNFTRVDEALVEELAGLTARGLARLEEDGLL